MNAERNPLFTPAPVCMSTYEAAVIATDMLALVGRARASSEKAPTK